MTQFVFLNGEILAKEDAKISPFDRGFLFGDAIYEVIPAYHGQLFHFDAHMERLHQSLSAIYLESPYDNETWHSILTQLLEKHEQGHYGIYLQISRGDTQQRDHFFPKNIEPTIFAMLSPILAPENIIDQPAVKAVSLPDIRWTRCDIKSTSRLAFSLMQQQAEDMGANTALIIRDGYLTESISSNVFVIKDGVIKTPPLSALLLSGITRQVILELANQEKLTLVETAIHESELLTADEIWLSSSTAGVKPVTHYQNQPIQNGKPGPIWRQMATAYARSIQTMILSRGPEYDTATA